MAWSLVWTRICVCALSGFTFATSPEKLAPIFPAQMTASVAPFRGGYILWLAALLLVLVVVVPFSVEGQESGDAAALTVLAEFALEDSLPLQAEGQELEQQVVEMLVSSEEEMEAMTPKLDMLGSLESVCDESSSGISDLPPPSNCDKVSKAHRVLQKTQKVWHVSAALHSQSPLPLIMPISHVWPCRRVGSGIP